MTLTLVVHPVGDFTVGRGDQIVEDVAIAHSVVVEIDKTDEGEFLLHAGTPERSVDRVARDHRLLDF